MGKAVLDDLLKTAQFDELVIADAGPNFKAEISQVMDARVKPVCLDVDDRKALVDLLSDAAVVIELLPIRYTMQLAQAAVEAGVHLISSVFIIDWSVQDPEGVRRQQEQMAEIDRLSREKGLTVVKEFGMDPGLDLIVAGQTVSQLDEVKLLYTFPEIFISSI